MRTEGSQKPTLTLVGGGKGRSGSAYDYSGHTRVVSTTSQKTPSQVLLEYLNSLDSEIQILESKYLEVLDTLSIVMSDLVRLGIFGSKINTTENVVE